jgi:hypothetical protein
MVSLHGAELASNVDGAVRVVASTTKLLVAGIVVPNSIAKPSAG